MKRKTSRPTGFALVRPAAAILVAIIACMCVFAACAKSHKTAAGQEPSDETMSQAPAPSSPQVPAFADRTKIPLAGKQGPPGEAATLIGDADHGEPLFAANCASCHGPQGAGKVPNPGSSDGTVPPLNPIDHDLEGADAAAFAAKIDPLIQHGSIPEGSNPALFMPDWGDSKTLTQQQIADIEAYIMRLNGVSR